MKAVKSKKCPCHSKKDIVATCASCLEACCSTCVGTHPATHNVIPPDTVWPLDELVKRVNDHELIAAQAERHQREHDEALKRSKEQVKRYTRQQIKMLHEQEAELLQKLDNHHTKVQTHIKVLQQLTRKLADTTKDLIKYLHSLQNQPKRHAELLVNQPALQARTQTLLLNKAPNSRYLCKDLCLQHITQMPHFEGGDSHAKHGTVSFPQHSGPLPAVSHIEQTLSSIVGIPDDTTTSPEGAGACNVLLPSDYRLRDNPPHLFDIYSPQHNVEPGSALFLPDDRLVVTERKAHKISIWKRNYKERACDIRKLDASPPSNDDTLPSNHLFPFAVTYWSYCDRLVYTDLRNWTVGLCAPNGEEMTSLKKELLKTPHGVGVLKSNYFVASDINLIEASKRQVNIINPHDSEIVRTFHKQGDGVPLHDHRNPTWITVLKDGRVTVTDTKANAVFVYDCNGQYIKHLSVPCPEQVIEGPKGGLLIASAGAYTSGNKVLLYDARELRYRQDVLSVHHPPQSIAVNNFGKLAVVHKTGVVQLFELYDC